MVDQVHYVAANEDELIAAIIANKAIKKLNPGQKKGLTVNDFFCIVEQFPGRRRVLVLNPAALYVVPSRKTDLSLGIATRSVKPPPVAFSPGAVDVVTNLTPDLLQAKKSGAGVTPAEFKKIRDGNLDITPVHTGKYDSLKHPGDVSWVSADKNVVLSWWGGAKYCTSAAFLTGLDGSNAPVVTTTMLGADATSTLSDVIDGTTPCAETPLGILAVDSYAGSRTIPPLLRFNLYKNGALWQKNCPGLAHGLYDKGLNLCSLWGDIVPEEGLWMIRPHVRLRHFKDPKVDADEDVTYTNEITITDDIGVKLPSGAFRKGLFLLMDELDGTTYPFYGKFDPTERAVHIYGVHSTSSDATRTNGIYRFSIPLGTAEIIGTERQPGSHRVVTHDYTPDAGPPPDPLTSDEVTWDVAVGDDSASYWNAGGGIDYTLSAMYMKTGTGEAVTRTLLSDIDTAHHVNRTDDELLAFMEAGASQYGRAVADSVSNYALNARLYREIGRKVKSVFTRSNLYGFDDSIDIVGSYYTVFTKPADYYTRPPTITKDFTYYRNDLSAVDHRDNSTVNAGSPLLIDDAVVDKYGVLLAALALAGYGGFLPTSHPTGTLGAAGLWGRIESISWTSLRVVGGGTLLDALPVLKPSTYDLRLGGTYGNFVFAPHTNNTTPYAFGTYDTPIDLLRYKYESTKTSTAIATTLSFGTMPPVQFTGFYTGNQHSIHWTEFDQSTLITERGESTTTIDVTPIPVILAYGDLRWPIAQQQTVAPWECFDSHGRRFRPGHIAINSVSTLGGTSSSITMQEIVFNAGESLLSPFAADALTTIPTGYTISDTYAARASEFIDHDDYIAGFYEATEVASGVDRYGGVPRKTDSSGALPAPSLNGLEYFWKYDIDPASTVLFGLPYGDLLDPATRPATWVRAMSSSTPPIRIAISGVWDDDVTYNSPIFVKKI